MPLFLTLSLGSSSIHRRYVTPAEACRLILRVVYSDPRLLLRPSYQHTAGKPHSEQACTTIFTRLFIDHVSIYSSERRLGLTLLLLFSLGYIPVSSSELPSMTESNSSLFLNRVTSMVSSNLEKPHLM